jgi:hypothetical protein
MSGSCCLTGEFGFLVYLVEKILVTRINLSRILTSLAACVCRGCSQSVDVSVAAADYCGTSKFASDAVLEALVGKQLVTVKPGDDLQSLVGDG